MELFCTVLAIKVVMRTRTDQEFDLMWPHVKAAIRAIAPTAAIGDSIIEYLWSTRFKPGTRAYFTFIARHAVGSQYSLLWALPPTNNTVERLILSLVELSGRCDYGRVDAFMYTLLGVTARGDQLPEGKCLARELKAKVAAEKPGRACEKRKSAWVQAVAPVLNNMVTDVGDGVYHVSYRGVHVHPYMTTERRDSNNYKVPLSRLAQLQPLFDERDRILFPDAAAVDGQVRVCGKYLNKSCVCCGTGVPPQGHQFVGLGSPDVQVFVLPSRHHLRHSACGRREFSGSVGLRHARACCYLADGKALQVLGLGAGERRLVAMLWPVSQTRRGIDSEGWGDRRHIVAGMNLVHIAT